MYPPASVFPRGRLGYDRIAEINPEGRQIRTVDREILFTNSKKSLRSLAARRDIPVVRRVDLWSLIADPFLDKGFDDEQQERTLRVLEENGVDREEVRDLRAKIGDGMLSYNARIWEWDSFDMKEVLDAEFSGMWSKIWRRRARREFEEFYWQFMDVACRAKALDEGALRQGG